MIGRLLLRLRQLGQPHALPRRLVVALLQIASEAEARALRPHERTLFREAYLRAAGARFTRPFHVAQGFRLHLSAPLHVGPRACFGENTGLYVHAPVTIGADFLAAPGLTVNNGTHHLATLRPAATPLTVGDRVWCAVNVTLVAGAQLGDDCVVGANSLVMDPIPPRCLAVGAPARVVRRDIRPQDAPDFWRGFAT